MMQCQTNGCGSLSGAIHIGANRWIRYCPICKTTTDIEVLRQPDQADKLASHGLAQLRRLDYAGAEQDFLEAADLVNQDAPRCTFYLWCSLIARYGVEYVQEVQFPNIPARRSNLFLPTFGRFPLPDHRITKTDACSRLDMLMLASPQLQLTAQIDELDILLREIEQCMQNEQNEFDVFIAWHDRQDDGNGPCRTFADRLNSSINSRRGCYSFVSFRSLHHVVVDRYEPHIYAALASAKVMVLVVDDYDALGQKFLASEIRRFASRRLQDPSLQIYFCGMKDHIGAVPAYMANWQRHQELCENEPVWVELVTRDVMDALRWARENRPKAPVPEPAPQARAEAKAEPQAAGKPDVESKPEPKTVGKPEPQPEPKYEPKPEPQPEAQPEVKAEPQHVPKPEPQPEAKPEPKPEPKPVPDREPTPGPGAASPAKSTPTHPVLSGFAPSSKPDHGQQQSAAAEVKKPNDRKKPKGIFLLIAVVLIIILAATASENRQSSKKTTNTSSTVTAQTSLDTAPPSPVIRFNKDASVAVTIPGSNDPLVSSYVLYRRANSSLAHAVRSFRPDDALSYTDTDIKAGNNYTYYYIVNRSDGTSYPESKTGTAKATYSYSGSSASGTTSSGTSLLSGSIGAAANTSSVKPTATPVPEKYGRYGAHAQGGNLCWIDDAVLDEDPNVYSADFTYYKTLSPQAFQTKDQTSGLYYRSKWNYNKTSSNHTVTPTIVIISPSGKMAKISYSSSTLSAVNGSSSWEWVFSVEDHIDTLLQSSPDHLLESGTYTVQHYFDDMILNTSSFTVQ